eukprot:COSAG06_NODE_622_length_13723_cov_258.262184_15_plen_66_part_00
MGQVPGHTPILALWPLHRRPSPLIRHAAVSAWKSLTRSQAELAWTRRWRVEFPVAVSACLRLPTR